MKPSTLALAAFAFAAALNTPASAETVTGSGTPATETRNAAGTRAVSLSVPGRLEIVAGDTEKLTLTGDDNVLPLVETLVERGELRIRFRERGPFNLRTRTPLRMTLTAKAIEGISISGSGEVVANTVDARKLALSIAGSGDITLGGKAQALEVQIAGSGNVRAGKLEARSAHVSIAGSGDATLWARESLEASIAGSGDVRYYGDPSVQRSVMGSGSIRRVGATPG